MSTRYDKALPQGLLALVAIPACKFGEALPTEADKKGPSPDQLFEYSIKAWQGPGRKGRLRRKPCTVLVQGKHRRDIYLS